MVRISSAEVTPPLNQLVNTAEYGHSQEIVELASFVQAEECGNGEKGQGAEEQDSLL